LHDLAPDHLCKILIANYLDIKILNLNELQAKKMVWKAADVLALTFSSIIETEMELVGKTILFRFSHLNHMGT
jgi:hypothetical protein